MKYLITPRETDVVIEANSPQEAMETFALTMDLDMNTYFKPVGLGTEKSGGNEDAILENCEHCYVY